MRTLLQTNNVVSGYENIEVICSVSIQIYESEIVSLIGPNGAGKSTLLKTIVGFLKPWKGKIFFEGEEVTRLSPIQKLQKGLVYVPQHRSVFPHMSVSENLEMGAYIIKDKQVVKARIKEILEKFPFFKENQKAGTLSGGQQRILEIARSLMSDPKILVLDEPSLGLSSKAQKIVFEKVKELNDAGATILMVEQNAFRALEISDRGYVLDLGKVRFEDSGKGLISKEEVRKMYLGA